MASLAARLGIAGVHQEPEDPCFEPVRIPQLGQVSPRLEQGALRGVLGQVRVAQDPARDRMEAVTHASDELVER